MISRPLILLACGLTFVTAMHAQSAKEAASIKSVDMVPPDPKIIDQCGMSMDVPAIKNLWDGTLKFGCGGSYKGIDRIAITNMDFQYDPNDRNGGYHIEFGVEGIGIDKKIAADGDRNFRIEEGRTLPILSASASFKESNCGDPVVRTTVTPISGPNWHGWLSEETFRESTGKCKPNPWYTSRFRCISAMVGNDKMTAQLTPVCLLRKREYSLEHGFSYDLFMDMLKTLRFKEG